MKRYLLIAKRLLGTACLFLSLSGNASPETVSDAGRRDYNIEVAGGSDPATFIPVTEIRGSKPGPTLFVATGVHGYEFAPILAAEKLAEAIDPKQLSGIVLVTRPSHVSAFEARSPYVNL